MELSHLSIDKTQGIVDALMRHEMKLSYSALSAFKRSPADFIRYKLGQKEQRGD